MRLLSRGVFAGISVVAFVASVVPSAALGAGTSVDLDQWAPLEALWQNGNLNASNARFPEGGVVPFRLALEGMSKGSHTIHINYDFTAGGHKAYDFLATWNAWRTPDICSKSGGAISSMCPGLPTSSSHAFPSDPYVANGLTVTGAQVYSAAPRRLTIWGGTISSIGAPVHSGSVNGNSSADFSVTFVANGPSVLLAWGGHIAQSRYWDRAAGNAPDGAGQVSGSPWHMRTLNLDGSGARNQDRSISPSAIVGELPPSALGPTPAPTPRPTPAAPAPTTPAPGDPAGPVGPTPFVSPPPTSTIVVRSHVADTDVELLALVAAGAACVALLIRRRRGLTR